MRGFGTGVDFLVAQNRLRAVSKAPVIKGGAAGAELAKAARMATAVTSGMMELDGVRKPKFVLGLHPVDQSGLYVIP